ncbi:MAG TPA: transcriptional regulator [Acidimicrobiales bacterium]|jgi:DNA-binding winged helix-turn-helix (wHTH) protein|nr:transcriptional regulator [Acidimicrobiales bacterium]
MAYSAAHGHEIDRDELIDELVDGEGIWWLGGALMRASQVLAGRSLTHRLTKEEIEMGDRRAARLAAVIYAFGDCELDLRRYELRRGGVVRRVEPQVFDVLVLLVRERDRLVSKEEILDTVWGSRFVSESALTSRIKALRQAVGDDGKAQRVVRTVHGRGYQFVAEVVERVDDAPSASASTGNRAELPPQQIRFCAARDGVRLAYATMGAGPPLVKAANWLSHIDLAAAPPR